MDDQKIESLAKLLNAILNNQLLQFNITTSHHVSVYLNIFLEALQDNNGTPVTYDSFREQLWVRLAKDRPNFDKTFGDFVNVWTGWVNLYNELLNRGIITN